VARVPAAKKASPLRLVLDWDGTVTERDTLVMLLETFGRPLPDGTGSFREVMEAELATLRLTLPQAVAWLLEHVRVRPGFHALARARRPLIVSSSFEETIQPILEREGLELEVRANRVDAGADGWHVRWRDESVCSECGDACKRGSLPEPPFAYVGDGWSDHCPALAAERVFARDGLARYLEARGVPFEPFADLRDVAAALDAAEEVERR
jgi:2-hydroxy-3-keto-5-methylthiopentenyl-1-phosphate phosphatase